MSKLSLLREKLFEDKLEALEKEYEMRKESFETPIYGSTPYHQLSNMLFAVEFGNISPQGVKWWTDKTLDACLKYIEMSGMVRLRDKHKILRNEKERRKREEARLTGH